MIVQLLFAFSILLSGLLAGIGFANLTAYMPAFEQMKQAHALSMWQWADTYFRARMPFIVIFFQVILLLTAIAVYGHVLVCILVSTSLLLSIVEVVIIKKKNLPLNIRVQATGEKVPADFEKMRIKAIKIFNQRAVMGCVAFILVITAWIIYNLPD